MTAVAYHDVGTINDMTPSPQIFVNKGNNVEVTERREEGNLHYLKKIKQTKYQSLIRALCHNNIIV